MKYLVCINHEGIQCKMQLGHEPERTELEIKSAQNRNLIKEIFFRKEDPRTDISFINDQKEIAAEIMKKYDVSTGYYGYQIRKTTIGKHIEVVVDMPEKEFNKSQGSLEGAINILHHTTKLMSPKAKTKDAAKIVLKWINRLESEKEID